MLGSCCPLCSGSCLCWLQWSSTELVSKAVGEMKSPHQGKLPEQHIKVFLWYFNPVSSELLLLQSSKCHLFLQKVVLGLPEMDLLTKSRARGDILTKSLWEVGWGLCSWALAPWITSVLGRVCAPVPGKGLRLGTTSSVHTGRCADISLKCP